MSQPVLKHPGRWLWLLLLIPVVLGLTRLRFDVEVFDLLPNDLLAVQGLKLYQQHFANARELIVTVTAADAEQAETGARSIAQRLAQQTNLVASATWEPPWLEHPEQSAELIGYLWFNQPPEIFGELTNHLALTNVAAVLAATRQELATSFSPQEIGRLSYDPFGLTRLPQSVAAAAPSFGEGQEMFASTNGVFRMIFVQANTDLATYRECDRWLREIQPIVLGAAAAVGLSAGQIGYTGRPAFVAETALGMEHDTTFSVGGTAVLIAILFWLAHRRVKPMLWLLTLLGIILGCTLALGGLIFGTINVVSMGFAAILLGLAVDYAVVHYQEALAQPHLSIPEIRHAIAPSIFWAAVTTISAFLVLNLGGLPGLAQLGTLVALGVGLAAIIMIFEFLPPLFPERRQPRTPLADAIDSANPTTPPLDGQMPLSVGPSPTSFSAVSASAPSGGPSSWHTRRVFALTAVLLLATSAALLSGLPRLDPSANALRPSKSNAYATLEQIQSRLTQRREPLWLIVRGRTEAEVGRRLDEVQALLARAVSNRLIADFTLPTLLWPRPEAQTRNRTAARHISANREYLLQAAKTNGFAERGLVLTQGILAVWQRASETEGVFWPTNRMSEWIFQKLAARTSTNFFAVGLIKPGSTMLQAKAALQRLQSELPRGEVWLSGWELLGDAIFSRVKANLWKLLAPMLALVLLSLWLAFHRALEVVLSLAVLLGSGLCLLAIMRLAGWSWNLLNLMSIPLILGTGVDYSIFMQLALRRHKGDLPMAYLSVGRALLLCGATAVAGFGSLAWSSNMGMASLGCVCAFGIGSNMLIAIFLLPVWWRATMRAFG